MALVNVDARATSGLVVVTLNDPDRRNAMTTDMAHALATTMDELAENPELRVVVLTGSPPAFSAGGDLGMIEEHARRTREGGYDAADEAMAFYERFLTVRDLPVPVIAAVNGHAVGAGLCLAMACDLRILADDAKMGLSFARLGLHPGMGGTWLLPRVLGTEHASELLYTGRLATGEEMVRRGFGLEAVAPAAVLPRALDLAAEIAVSAPQVVRQLKGSLRNSPRNDLRDQLRIEAANQSRNFASDDLLEGVRALRERRAPHFSGR